MNLTACVPIDSYCSGDKPCLDSIDAACATFWNVQITSLKYLKVHKALRHGSPVQAPKRTGLAIQSQLGFGCLPPTSDDQSKVGEA